MPINMDDPRVRKTRKALQEALLRLIIKQGYDSITIQDIATESDMARITFYRHYHDKEDLLMDCLNALYEDLAYQTEHVSHDSFMQGKTPVRILYDHIEAHEGLYRILFTSRGTSTVIDRVRHHMVKHAMIGFREFWGDVKIPDLPLELIAIHTSSAQLGLAMWWLNHDKPYPADYMANLSVWISLSGVLGTLGIHDVTVPMPRPNE